MVLAEVVFEDFDLYLQKEDLGVGFDEEAWGAGGSCDLTQVTNQGSLRIGVKVKLWLLQRDDVVFAELTRLGLGAQGEDRQHLRDSFAAVSQVDLGVRVRYGRQDR